MAQRMEICHITLMLRLWFPVKPAPALLMAGLLTLPGFTPPSGAAALDNHPPNVKSELRFNRDIRPILSDNCFHCHGPEVKSRKAKLRLDVREAAIEKEAIVPGKPGESEMIRRLETTDADDQMPPPDTHKIVTPAQREILRRWITEGATYEAHWAYAPLNRPAIPSVSDSKWPQTPVDAFVLARLEEQKIKPAPAADRRTLLRRLSLDLTGLPPTPDEVERFAKDRSRRAYEKQVERLLASPHFGERMAVPWLDAVRFTDTVGYHGDQNQNIFPYRDYVIDSFNRNKPFDQFTIEQIAGDLLPNPTVEQRIATGFNRLNMMTREGGAQPQEYLAKYQADRVRTVSTAWLGSTMACAECHDHKYDPFTAKDFYSLAAFFGDVKQWGVYTTYGYTPNPDLPGWSNEHPFPPELVVTNQPLLRREAKLRATAAQLIQKEFAATTASEIGRQSFQAWQADLRNYLKTAPDGWRVSPNPEATFANTNSKARLTIQPDGSILCTGKSAANEKIQIRLTLEPGWVSALRLELLPHATHSNSSLRIRKGDAEMRVRAELKRASGPTKNLVFHHSAATVKASQYRNGHEALDVHPTWKLPATTGTNRQFAVYLLDPPLAAVAGDSLLITLESDEVGAFRIATSPLADPTALNSGATREFTKALQRSPARRSAKQNQFVASAWLHSTTNNPPAFAQLKQLNREILECRNGFVPTLVTEATTNRLITRVLPRGNWQDESGPIVEPAVPHFLPQPKLKGANQLTRLDLAHWLVAPENPLTARAFVNRLWKQFFGNGLSNQPEELGAQGESPTHPELLDWLGVEFRESGWDVKHVVRLMVTSAVYQQDARIRPELRDVDPNNRLLARQNPRRLEAEFIRDNALFIAGLLDSEIGGPSAFPYQPEDYYSNIQFPNRTYVASPDDRQYRRGVYAHWQRTFLHPMLANFDAPAREECAVDRPVSSTPQQALTLLNDPSFVEAARVFAEKLLRTPKLKTDAARINFTLETALLRPAKTAEQESLLKFLAAQRTFYAANPGDAEKLLRVGQHPAAPDLKPAEHAAWTSLTRVVLNLHETITRY
jgi:hypothetical protein